MTEPDIIPEAHSTFRERIVLWAGGIIVLMTAVIIFLSFQLSASKSAQSCDISRAQTAATIQLTRQTLGNEGRAAAAALATSTIAAATSPANVRVSLVQTAETIYANTMITVNAGLATHPVIPVEAC